MVERFGQCQNTVPADATPGGLQAHDSAGGRWEPNRAPGVAAQGAETEPGRRRHARAARRRARPALRVPGIYRNLEVRVVAAHGSFGEVELAQEYRACRLQPGDHGRVETGDVLRQHLAPPHGAHPLRVAQVLNRHGHAMKWSAVLAPADLPFRTSGGLPCMVGHQRGIALEAVVQFLDAPKHHVGDFDGRDLSRPN